MSDNDQFIPYEVAMQIVGNVVEEEHLHEQDRRILTVYDKNANELCWFDAKDVLAEAQPDNPKDQDSVKMAAVEVVMRQIPKWAVEDLLAKLAADKKGSVA